MLGTEIGSDTYEGWLKRRSIFVMILDFALWFVICDYTMKVHNIVDYDFSFVPDLNIGRNPKGLDASLDPNCQFLKEIIQRLVCYECM